MSRIPYRHGSSATCVNASNCETSAGRSAGHRGRIHPATAFDCLTAACAVVNDAVIIKSDRNVSDIADATCGPVRMDFSPEEGARYRTAALIRVTGPHRSYARRRAVKRDIVLVCRARLMLTAPLSQI